MKMRTQWKRYVKRLRNTNKNKTKQEDEFTVSTELIQELKKHAVVQKFMKELNRTVRSKFDKTEEFEVTSGLEEKDE